MDVREKLVELICRFCSGLAVSDITPPYGYENLADFMISNGVTVQEWISVKEPPKEIRNAKTMGSIKITHGKWVSNGIPESILSACSVCGFPCGASTFNYCPQCGAMMDK